MSRLGAGQPCRIDEGIECEGEPAGTWRAFLVRFIPAGVAIVAVLGLIAANEWWSQAAVYRQALDSSFEIARTVVDDDLKAVEADLVTLIGSDELKRMLAGDAAAREAYVARIIAFAEAKRTYSKIEYIDEKGAEIVRIELGASGAAAVPQTRQHESSQLDYMREGNALVPGELLISPLGLGVEGDQVRKPPQPTIRFVGAVFDTTGTRRGIIAIDYLAAQLIAELRRAMAHVAVPMLLNGDGYWLAGPNSSDEFAFMWPDRRNRSFAATHPEAWAQISAAGRGYASRPEGQYAFETLAYLRKRPSRQGASFFEPRSASAGPGTETWKLVAFRPKSLATTTPELGLFLTSGALLLLLAAMLCAQLSREEVRRVAARSALVASERRLREQLDFTQMLLESMPVPVFLKDGEGRYRGCNHAFEALVGRTRADIVGRTADEVLPADEAALDAEKDKQILQLREKQTYEAQGVDAHGELRHWLVFKSPSSNSLSGNGSLVGVILDISERKVAEKSLRNGQQFVTRILNAIPQPIFVKNRSHRFVFLNDAACAHLGFSREKILGKTNEEIFPKEHARTSTAEDEDVFASGASVPAEEKITDASGVEHTVVTKKAVFENDYGEKILVGVITDITDRKRMEEVLRLGAEVFEHSAEGIMVTGRDGTILSVNRAFSEITGYSIDEAIGCNARMLGSGQHDGAFFRTIFETCATDGRWKGEIVNRRKDGAIYVVEQTICAVRDDTGQIKRYIAIVNDITERKSSEERMRYLAQHDALTGLANRSLLRDRIERAIVRVHRNRRKVAVLMLDLDGFKAINDTHGHALGDKLLIHVASRLVDSVRQTDTVSRIGGDEFVIVLADVRGRDDAERIAHKLIDEFARPFELDSVRIEIGASIGIALYPDDAQDADALCRSADAAMYQRKNASRRSTGAELASPRH